MRLHHTFTPPCESGSTYRQSQNGVLQFSNFKTHMLFIYYKLYVLVYNFSFSDKKKTWITLRIQSTTRKLSLLLINRAIIVDLKELLPYSSTGSSIGNIGNTFIYCFGIKRATSQCVCLWKKKKRVRMTDVTKQDSLSSKALLNIL